MTGTTTINSPKSVRWWATEINLSTTTRTAWTPRWVSSDEVESKWKDTTIPPTEHFLFTLSSSSSSPDTANRLLFRQHSGSESWDVSPRPLRKQAAHSENRRRQQQIVGILLPRRRRQFAQVSGNLLVMYLLIRLSSKLVGSPGPLWAFRSWILSFPF